MIKRKDLKDESDVIRIHEFDFPEQLDEKLSRVIEELLDLNGKYKAKRNLWEVKLKANDDPRKPDFYAIMARLTMLDMMVADLEYLIWLLVEMTGGKEIDAETYHPTLQI